MSPSEEAHLVSPPITFCSIDEQGRHNKGAVDEHRLSGHGAQLIYGLSSPGAPSEPCGEIMPFLISFEMQGTETQRLPR